MLLEQRNWKTNKNCNSYGFMKIHKKKSWVFPLPKSTMFFSEMGQSSLICNLHGFGKKGLVD